MNRLGAFGRQCISRGRYTSQQSLAQSPIFTTSIRAFGACGSGFGGAASRLTIPKGQHRKDIEALEAAAYKLTINGQDVKGESFFSVTNPYSGLVFAKCPDATPLQVRAAIAAAKAAFPLWRATPVDERKKLLAKVAVELQSHLEEISKVLVQEQGKPLKEARGEVKAVIARITSTCKMELPATEIIQDDKKACVKVEYRPLGVVAAITPWNFPVSLLGWKVVPALVTGNTVVVKPSPNTPLSTLLVGKVFASLLPAGVINVVSGGNDVGAWLTESPDVAKVSFTGSVETGKAIQRVCAKDLKRVTLELGGNDAAIVLADADVRKVAPKIFAAAFANNGQVCSAIKRVYVPDALYDDVVLELVSYAIEARVGDGRNHATTLGPIQNEAQLDKVLALVHDARKRGGLVNCGGKRVRNMGFCFHPTIISNVDETFDIVTQEQFGPVLPVVRYTDVADAVRQANDSKFGLSGSVWGSDVAKAEEVASQLEVGTAWVNTHLNVRPDAPFGGVKWSGIGREGGKWGLHAYLEPVCVNVSKV